jgi:hypothetical protein
MKAQRSHDYPLSQAWWHMSVMPATQENHKFKASPGKGLQNKIKTKGLGGHSSSGRALAWNAQDSEFNPELEKKADNILSIKLLIVNN